MAARTLQMRTSTSSIRERAFSPWPTRYAALLPLVPSFALGVPRSLDPVQGKNSNRSQFFMTLRENKSLDGKYVVFGRKTRTHARTHARMQTHTHSCSFQRETETDMDKQGSGPAIVCFGC